MELKKLSEHIWYMPFEEERDRPNLGYVRGDKRSLAIDAGHSEAHIREFYSLLQKEGLPLPSLTVLTHWHWDHTFAMHAVNGLTLANRRTNGHLLECMKKIETEGPDEFLNMYDSIRKEYEGNSEVIVVPAADALSGSYSHKRLTQTIQHLFMCVKIRRSLSGTQPVRNSKADARTRSWPANWQTRSARQAQILVSKDTGSL